MRASTSKQELSPEIQREQISHYCKAKGFAEPIFYLDKATSGGVHVRDRDAGGKLMRDLRKGDQVILAKADRMFRKLGDCVNVCDEFRRLEVSLHIVNFNGMAIDLGTPIGRALLHMMACFAELERDIIKERARDTARAIKRAGRAHGMPKYGFKHAMVRRDGKMINMEVPDPEEREVMAIIANLKRKRWSVNQIREYINYELKLKTRDGKDWDNNRISRVVKAELLLQLRELGTCNADSY